MTTTITATHGDLTRAMREASRVSGKRTYVPVLAWAHVSAGVDGFTVRSTDFEVSAERDVPGSCSADTLLPIWPCVAALKGIRGAVTPRRAERETVTFTLDGDKLHLSGFGRDLIVHDGDDRPSIDDYPSAPPATPESGRSLTVDATTFTAAFKFAHVASGKDGTLPMLTTVSITATDGVVELAATDRYRLAVCELDGVSQGDWQVLVPRETLAHLADLAGKLAVSIGEGHVSIVHDSGRVYVRTVDVTFPKYRQLILSDGDMWTVNRKRLLDDAASAAAVVDRREPIRLTFTENAITVQGNSPIPAESTLRGDGEVRAFNPAHLTDMLKSFDSDSVDVQSVSPGKPHLFRGDVANVRNALHLVMPARRPG